MLTEIALINMTHIYAYEPFSAGQGHHFNINTINEGKATTIEYAYSVS